MFTFCVDGYFFSITEIIGCLAYHKFNTAIGPSVKLVITNIIENNKKHSGAI